MRRARERKTPVHRRTQIKTDSFSCIRVHPWTFLMKLFTELYVELDQTNKTNEKVEAMKFYFERAAPHDAAWALYFLSGRKPRQIVPSKFLRDWSIETSGIPEWLYYESRDTVGDGAETSALLMPNHEH